MKLSDCRLHFKYRSRGLIQKESYSTETNKIKNSGVTVTLQADVPSNVWLITFARFAFWRMAVTFGGFGRRDGIFLRSLMLCDTKSLSVEKLEREAHLQVRDTHFYKDEVNRRNHSCAVMWV